jgi:hypothetical protein
MSEPFIPHGKPPVDLRHRDPLDRALASLPKDVPPSRDLWPAIAAAIREPAAVVDTTRMPRRPLRLWLQIAAGFLLIVASSVTTYFVMQRSMQRDTLQAQQEAARRLMEAPPMPAMPVSFAGAESLGADYLQTRAALNAEFQKRLAELPPAARARLQSDLGDLRRAATDIAATLATHPSHPLLQQLLLSTYQNELALMSSVNEMTAATAPETRL